VFSSETAAVGPDRASTTSVVIRDVATASVGSGFGRSSDCDRTFDGGVPAAAACGEAGLSTAILSMSMVVTKKGSKAVCAPINRARVIV